MVVGSRSRAIVSDSGYLVSGSKGSGSFFNSSLTMCDRINSICRSAYLELLRIGSGPSISEYIKAHIIICPSFPYRRGCCCTGSFSHASVTQQQRVMTMSHHFWNWSSVKQQQHVMTRSHHFWNWSSVKQQQHVMTRSHHFWNWSSVKQQQHVSLYLWYCTAPRACNLWKVVLS